jgi:hypothetical protein
LVAGGWKTGARGVSQKTHPLLENAKGWGTRKFNS